MDFNIDHGRLTESTSKAEGDHRTCALVKDPNTIDSVYNTLKVSASKAEGEQHLVFDIVEAGLNKDQNIIESVCLSRDPNTIESAYDALKANNFRMQQEAASSKEDSIEDVKKEMHHDSAELLENPMMVSANEWVFLTSNEKDKQKPPIQEVLLFHESNEDETGVMHDDMPLCAFVSRSRSKRKVKNLDFKEAESRKKGKKDVDEVVSLKSVSQALDLPRKLSERENQHIDDHMKLELGLLDETNEQNEAPKEFLQKMVMQTRGSKRNNPSSLILLEAEYRNASDTGGLKGVRGKKKPVAGIMQGNLQIEDPLSRETNSLHEIETDDGKLHAEHLLKTDGNEKADSSDAHESKEIHSKKQLQQTGSIKNLEQVDSLRQRKKKRKAKSGLVEEADGKKSRINGSVEHGNNTQEKHFKDKGSIGILGKTIYDFKTDLGCEEEDNERRQNMQKGDDERDVEELCSGVLQMDGRIVKPNAYLSKEKDEKMKSRNVGKRRLNTGLQQENSEKMKSDTDEDNNEINTNAELIVCETNLDTYQGDVSTTTSDPNFKIIQKPRSTRNNNCSKKSTWGVIDVLQKVSEDLEMEMEKESSESKLRKKSGSAERAFRHPRKKQQSDIMLEGDMEWEAVMGESDVTIAKCRKSTRTKSGSELTIFAEGLNGDVAAVTVGLQLNTLTPAERIRFKDSLKRRGGLQEYLDCRYDSLDIFKCNYLCCKKTSCRLLNAICGDTIEQSGDI